jgi:hypothetical protein
MLLRCQRTKAGKVAGKELFVVPIIVLFFFFFFFFS